MEAVLSDAKNRPGLPTSNAFAAIRPPGHHASRDAACGFCLFNNISICAKKVITILIQDFITSSYEILLFLRQDQWESNVSSYWIGIFTLGKVFLIESNN